MQYIDFKVQHQTITRTDSYEVVGGSQNYLYARFSFCTEWADITPTAVFSTNSGKHIGVAIENGECLVPWEVLTGAEFWVGVFGGDRITTSTVRVPVKPGAKHNASPGVQPTPPAYEILMSELREGVTNANESAEAAESAATQAAESAAEAESAKETAIEALDSFMSSNTPIINNLTTGGKTAALSAEMGKQLEQSKVPAVTVYYSGVMSADDLTVPLALIPINSTSNAGLHTALGATHSFAYIRTIFYGKADTASNRVQTAFGYRAAAPKMVFRTYHASDGGWSAWKDFVGSDDVAAYVASNAVAQTGGDMTGSLTIARANPDIRLNDSAIGNVASMVGTGNTLILRNYNTGSSSIRRQVELRNSDRESSIATALKLWDVTADGTVGYDILHTGNKPTGSYQGTSSTEQQDIDTKGIGSCIYIHGGTLGAIVGKSGGLGWDTNGGTIKTLTYAAAHFVDGVLTIATDSFYVNNSAVNYTYQVL